MEKLRNTPVGSELSLSIALRIPGESATEQPLPWAIEQLRRAVDDRGGALVTDETAARVIITLEPTRGADLAEDEAFRFRRTGDSITVQGAPRGLAYGITELADRIRYATDPVAELLHLTDADSTPATPVRSVLRAFSSDAFDLDWYRDRDFWTNYLDHLAANRINRVQLALGMPYNYSHDPGVYDNYFGFAYPFLIDLPGWQVRAVGVDADERARNLAALRFASDAAAERGIEFFLGLWSHAVQPELEANENLRYPIRGLAESDTAEYSAQALSAILAECPSIGGVTFRVHYEGGVHEAGRVDFWTTIFAGLASCDRPVTLDMHAKGVDAELLDAAHAAVDRVSLSPKYWAEHQGLPYHQARVRDLERARPADTDGLAGVTRNTRRFTRYGYGDFLPTSRKTGLIFRMWPGTQRLLLWADPELFAGYGREGTIGGAQGVELCEPLTFRGRKNSGHGPRDLYVDDELHQSPADDWRKYAYTYRLWGRLLYNPDADPEEWRRYLRATVGEAAEPALSAAGRILPLTTVAVGISASCNYYWPEVPVNLPLLTSIEHPYAFDTPEPHDWAGASPFDPELFDTTRQFVDGLLDGTPSGRITPLWVADTIERLAETALAEAALAEAASIRPDGEDGPQRRRIAVDVAILAELGRMQARRLRGGVQFELFQRTGDAGRLAAALQHLEASRAALAAVVRQADGVYFRDLGFGDRPTERGHWRDRLEQLDVELAELRALRTDESGAPAADPTTVDARISGISLSETRHDESGDFQLHVHGLPDGGDVVFHVRPLNQGAEWETARATSSHGVVSLVVPAETSATYPLQWYATLQLPGRPPVNHPELGDDLSGRPYRVVAAA